MHENGSVTEVSAGRIPWGERNCDGFSAVARRVFAGILRRMNKWWLAARPKTLPAAVAPVWLGSSIGALFREGGGSRWLGLCTLMSCLCIQIATNFFNDAVDSKKGADTAQRLGPQRVTANRMASGRAVMLAAAVMCLLAAACSVPLILERGWLIVLIGAVSLWFSYGYTGGPFPLAYLGLGEVFVILFFGLVAVAGSAWVQCGQWRAEAVLAGLQLGCLSAVLIAVNNARDLEEDRLHRKRTLAARFGLGFARGMIAVLALAPYALGMLWWRWFHAPQVALVPLILLPFSLMLTRNIFKTEPSSHYNRFLAQAALLLLSFTLALLLAFPG